MKSQLRLIKSNRVGLTVSTWRDDYLESKRVKLEAKTISNYSKTINLYIEFVGETHWPPTRFDVIRFLDDVMKRSSQITAFSYWAILRAWFNYMAKLGAFDHFPNPAEQITQLDLAPKNPKLSPKGIPRNDIDKLFAYLRALPGGLLNIRDLALIHFLYRSGARVGEAADLTKQTLQLEINRVLVQAEMVKDDEDMRMYFGEKVKADLKVWLQWLEKCGYDDVWVFPSTRGQRPLNRSITPAGINQMFHCRLREAGLPMYRVHDLRHSFTKEAMRQKKSLSSIQRQLGHATPDMVLRYANVFSQEQAEEFSNFGDDE